jgi:hypothetical protein
MSRRSIPLIKLAEVEQAALRDARVGLDVLVPKPPVDWFVRGPRGGLRYAQGGRRRYISDDDFTRDVVLVVDRSAGSRPVPRGQRSIIVQGRRVVVPEAMP